MFAARWRSEPVRRRFRGPLLARVALAGSENVPAVSLASQVGIPKLLRFLSRAGLSSFDRTASYYGVGLTLGNAEGGADSVRTPKPTNSSA